LFESGTDASADGRTAASAVEELASSCSEPAHVDSDPTLPGFDGIIEH
jgi:hypothetical protein